MLAENVEAAGSAKTNVDFDEVLGEMETKMDACTSDGADRRSQGDEYMLTSLRVKVART